METKQIEMRDLVRRFSLVSIIGFIIYALITILLAFYRPSFSVLYDAVSDYGNGEKGWLLGIGFIVKSALILFATLVFLIAISRNPRRNTGIVLLLIWSSATALLAVFPDDLRNQVPTFHGRMHMLIAMTGFLTSAIGTFLFTLESREMPARKSGSIVLAIIWIISVCGFIALILSASVKTMAIPLGLSERVFVYGLLVWICIAMIIARGKAK